MFQASESAVIVPYRRAFRRAQCVGYACDSFQFTSCNGGVAPSCPDPMFRPTTKRRGRREPVRRWFRRSCGVLAHLLTSNLCGSDCDGWAMRPFRECLYLGILSFPWLHRWRGVTGYTDMRARRVFGAFGANRVCSWRIYLGDVRGERWEARRVRYIPGITGAAVVFPLLCVGRSRWHILARVSDDRRRCCGAASFAVGGGVDRLLHVYRFSWGVQRATCGHLLWMVREGVMNGRHAVPPS